MVGLIHRILLDLLDELVGPSGIEAILKRAEIPLDTVFRIDTNYSDEQFRALLAAVMAETGLDQPTLETRYATQFLIDSKKRWPMWFQISKNAREFLTRQPKIHNGFASSMHTEAERDLINDKFHLDETERQVIVHYKSPNQLCGLYKALALEVLQEYGEQAEISESKCLKDGDDECCITIEWPAD